MTRFAPLLAAVTLAGCGPTEVGTAYRDAEPAEVPEAGSSLAPGALDLATRGGESEPAADDDAPEEVPEPPAADAPDPTPSEANKAEAADEEFAGGFSGGFAAPAPPEEGPEVLNDSAADGPRELKLLVPINSFSPAGDGTVRVSFDDLDLLRVLNAEPVPADVADHLPDWLRDLDGEEVTLRGFMYPTYADPVRAFILARDNQICCFGRNPKPYDLVTVKLAEGEESRYIQNRPFDVVGTFRLDPRREDGAWLRLYRIDGARVVE